MRTFFKLNYNQWVCTTLPRTIYYCISCRTVIMPLAFCFRDYIFHTWLFPTIKYLKLFGYRYNNLYQLLEAINFIYKIVQLTTMPNIVFNNFPVRFLHSIIHLSVMLFGANV